MAPSNYYGCYGRNARRKFLTNVLVIFVFGWRDSVFFSLLYALHFLVMWFDN